MNSVKTLDLYLFDIKNGFRENKIKIVIACVMFLFFANVTVKQCMLCQVEVGFWIYWTNILGGMPEYIKTETSTFELPVSWFLFYAYLYFLIGFYPITDLYNNGSHSLILSESRNKWMLSKFFWIVTMILFYFIIFTICLMINVFFIGEKDIALSQIITFYGLSPCIHSTEIIINYLVLPIITTIAMAVLQFVISIIWNAIYGYMLSVIILVVSVYWMKPFLIGNYLIVLRSGMFATNGMISYMGFVFDMGIIIFMMILGCLLFRKKDILKIREKI
ncbi:MAG: hypothetical protein II073_08165 [Lachnospiraceae bacterium]|nr:hypothetical protein [Lachnospiraceae bacterium]